MKWQHPEAVMRAKLRNEKPSCIICQKFNLAWSSSDSDTRFCGVYKADPKPRINDLREQVCAKFMDKPE